MNRARPRSRVGRPAFVMGTAALVSIVMSPLASGAPLAAVAVAAKPSASGPAREPECPTPGDVARGAHGRSPGKGHAQARAVINGSGEFVGRTLFIAPAAGDTRSLTLPAESFVGGREGDAVVYISVTGGHSDVHLIDLASGCDVLLARHAGIARSAVLDRSAEFVYVHSVGHPDRRDMGVMRYALDGSSSSVPVVAPLPDDSRFGPTFGTQLAWSIDGSALAVQSCAIESCRTRLLDVATSSVATLDALGQGALIGVTSAHLVAYGTCSGLPCSVLGIDRASGATQALADEAWSASLVATQNGLANVVIETAAGVIEVEQ